VIRLRTFRNGDPPALADLWNRGLPGRGVVRPLGPHELNEQVLTRLTFDREGLILAEDEGRLVGFAHAEFGPAAARGPSHRLDREMGTVAMLVLDPDRDDPAVGRALFAEAEGYLLGRGAKVLYAGGQSELSSCYSSLYGGSECSGILTGHPAFRRASEESGYQPVAESIHLDADLAAPDGRDPRTLLLRRRLRVDVVDDALPASWWEANAIGQARITRFRVFSKLEDKELARASTWDMAAFGRLDGKARAGLIDVEVDEDERNQGFGRYLVSEVLRYCRNDWGEFVSVQARSTNLAAIGLYESLGFVTVDSSTLYRKPGSRAG